MEDIVKWRRDLHRIPEIGLKEYKTAEYLRSELKKMGYSYFSVMQTDTIVYIDNQKEETLAFRSDIDALMIEEKNNIEYKSIHPGYMHACGHDGHMAALLELAKRLKKHNDHKYNYLFIFQPGEEAPGGARHITNSGILKKYHVKAIFGMHLMPFLDEGIISTKSGPLMAMCAQLDVEITGKSSHAGLPHEGVDSIMIASEVINGYQKIISRKLSPFVDSVIHIGKIQGGDARNIVSSKVIMKGTIRVFDEETFDFITREIYKLHRSMEMVYNCVIKESYPPMYPPVINDQIVYNRFIEIIDSCIELKEPLMLAEDFSFYQKEIPGLFFYLGVKSDIYRSGLHTESFNFNEDILKIAADIYEKIAIYY